MGKCDLFISYSSHDRDWVKTFVSHLEQLGVRVWWDVNRIKYGESFISAIDAGLTESGRLILIVSPASMASPWVRREYTDVMVRYPNFDQTGRIIPVIISEASRPPLSSDCQYINLTYADSEKYRMGMQKLISGYFPHLKEGLATASLQLPSPPNYEINGKLWTQAVNLFSELSETRWDRKLLYDKLPPDIKRKSKDILENKNKEISSTAFLFYSECYRMKKLKSILAVQDIEEVLRSRNPDEYESLLKELDKSEPHPAIKSEWIRKIEEYLKSLEMLCRIDLSSRIFPEAHDLPLQKVYVDLYTEPYDRARDFESGACRTDYFRHLSSKERSEYRTGTLENFLKSGESRCWTLQGEPGSGKTTLLLDMCRRMIGDARETISAGDRKEIQAKLLIPVYVRIGAWRRRPESIIGYLDREFREMDLEGTGEFLKTESDAGRVVWFFDGLDEVDPKETFDAAEKISIHSQRFKQCKIVMTSRIFGYEKPPDAEDAVFKELKLLPLRREERKELLEELLQDKRSVEDVLDEIDRHSTLRELSGNPFFLTMIAIAALQPKIDDEYKPLPVRRSELLERVIDRLMLGLPGLREKGPFPDHQRVLSFLKELALDLMMHYTPPYRANEVTERIIFLDSKADGECRLLKNYQNEAAKFIRSLAAHTFLIMFFGKSENVCHFLHRSIQEYLAACALHSLEEEKWMEIAESLLPDKSDEATAAKLGRWAEIFGYLAGMADDPNAWLKKLMHINQDLGLRALSTTENVTEETLETMLDWVQGGSEWEKRRKIIESIPLQKKLGCSKSAVDLLDTIRRKTTHGADLFFISSTFDHIANSENVDAEVKKYALDRKRNIFEREQKVITPPDFLKTIVIKGKEHEYWSRIPAGNFLMGSPKDEEGRYDDEPENLPVSLSEFHMGKVPVTNRDYELFDPSHKDDRAFGDKETEMHPAVNVTWYEAIMFSRWATEILKRRGDLDDGEIITLPSEAQWEYACRAGKKTMFWSGDKEEDLDRVGWYDGNSGGRTHAVGEKSANPRGLFDMHGNVWEWCLDEWSGHYKRSGNDQIVGKVENISARRSIRGGSWGNDPRDCRSAFRSGRYPDVRFFNQGFRVVRVRRGPQA